MNANRGLILNTEIERIELLIIVDVLLEFSVWICDTHILSEVTLIRTYIQHNNCSFLRNAGVISKRNE